METSFHLFPDASGRLVKIGHYELGKSIGKGNFAVVKRAIHTITKSTVRLFLFLL